MFANQWPQMITNVLFFLEMRKKDHKTLATQWKCDSFMIQIGWVVRLCFGLATASLLFSFFSFEYTVFRVIGKCLLCLALFLNSFFTLRMCLFGSPLHNQSLRIIEHICLLFLIHLGGTVYEAYETINNPSKPNTCLGNWLSIRFLKQPGFYTLAEKIQFSIAKYSPLFNASKCIDAKGYFSRSLFLNHVRSFKQEDFLKHVPFFRRHLLNISWPSPSKSEGFLKHLDQIYVPFFKRHPLTVPWASQLAWIKYPKKAQLGFYKNNWIFQKSIKKIISRK